MTKLSTRQFELLNVIKNYIRENGHSPAIRDLLKPMRITSTNGIADHLKALEKKGRIKRKADAARTIVVVLDAELPKVKGIERKSNRTCKKAAGPRVTKPRPRLPRMSKKRKAALPSTTEKHAAYKLINTRCEILDFFPTVNGVPQVPTGLGRVSASVKGADADPSELHHILRGEPKIEETWNYCHTCAEAHRFCTHVAEHDGRVLCITAKIKKGEWNQEAAWAARDKNPLWFLANPNWKPQFEFVEEHANRLREMFGL